MLRDIKKNTNWLKENRANLTRTETEVAFLEQTLRNTTPQTTQIEDQSNVLLYAMYGYDGTYVINGGDRDYVLSVTNPPKRGGHYNNSKGRFINLNEPRTIIILAAIENRLAQKQEYLAKLKQEVPAREQGLTSLYSEEAVGRQRVARLGSELNETIDSLNEHEFALWETISDHSFQLTRKDFSLLLEMRLALYPDRQALPQGERIIKYVTPTPQTVKSPSSSMMKKTITSRNFSFGKNSSKKISSCSAPFPTRTESPSSTTPCTAAKIP